MPRYATAQTKSLEPVWLGLAESAEAAKEIYAEPLERILEQTDHREAVVIDSFEAGKEINLKPGVDAAAVAIGEAVMNHLVDWTTRDTAFIHPEYMDLELLEQPTGAGEVLTRISGTRKAAARATEGIQEDARGANSTGIRRD